MYKNISILVIYKHKNIYIHMKYIYLEYKKGVWDYSDPFFQLYDYQHFITHK